MLVGMVNVSKPVRACEKQGPANWHKTTTRGQTSDNNSYVDNTHIHVLEKAG